MGGGIRGGGDEDQVWGYGRGLRMRIDLGGGASLELAKDLGLGKLPGVYVCDPS